MAATQVNPTRMELTRLKKKLVTATRGRKLLKDKRDELMRQFLDMARENMALREKVEAGIKAANTNFVIAKAGMSEQILHTALMAPKQEVQLTCKDRNVMSVDIPVFEYTTKSADPFPAAKAAIWSAPASSDHRPLLPVSASVSPDWSSDCFCPVTTGMPYDL